MNYSLLASLACTLKSHAQVSAIPECALCFLENRYGHELQSTDLAFLPVDGSPEAACARHRGAFSSEENFNWFSTLTWFCFHWESKPQRCL